VPDREAVAAAKGPRLSSKAYYTLIEGSNVLSGLIATSVGVGAAGGSDSGILVGIVLAGVTVAVTLATADAALYDAMRSGRDRIAVAGEPVRV
jgi:hypothetical protein